MDSPSDFILDHGDTNKNYQSDTILTEILPRRFSDINYVLENAANTAILLNYLYTKSKDINSLLFYSVVKKYERICQKKDEMRNYLNCNMEIFTVFVHQSSILKIPINNSLLQNRIIGNLSSEDCLNQYIMVLEEVKKKTIQHLIDDYVEHVKSQGDDFAFDFMTSEMSKSDELALIDKVHSYIRSSLVRYQKSRCLPLSPQITTKMPQGSVKLKQLQKHLGLDQEIRAKFQALATQYEYFHINNSMYPAKFSTNAIDATVPSNSFLNNSAKKLKKIRIKGHFLQECSPPSIENCLFCNIIIWGSFPMCFYCKICRNYFHHSCKDLINDCIKEEDTANTVSAKASLNSVAIKRKQSRGLESLRQIFKFDDDSVASSQSSHSKTDNSANMSKIPMETNNITEEVLTEDPDEDQEITPNSPKSNKSNSIRFGLEYSKRSKAERTSSLKEEKRQKYAFLEKSLQRKLEVISDVNQAKTKLTMRNCNKSEDVDIRSKRRSKSQSRSEEENDSKPQTRLRHCQAANSRRSSVFVPIKLNLLDFISDQPDEELTVPNAFEPEIELKNFPDFDRSDPKSETYARHMVMMEFHHKVKYIRKFFKEIQIYLVHPWRSFNENMELFEILSLDSVGQIYSLINDLVECIENCTNSSGYNKSIGSAILNWFTEDCYANLHNWSTLAIDLFCTNILYSVTNAWKDQQKVTSHPLSQLLTQRHNKMVVIEQLGNMRPLLLSLPTITLNLSKTLKKSSLYKDELPDWQEIMKILCYVPKTIDKKCMPVVTSINQCRIQNGIGSKHKNNNNIITSQPSTPLPISPSSTKLTTSNSNSSNSSKVKHSNSTDKNNEASAKLNETCKEDDEMCSKISRYVQNFPKSMFKRNFVDFQYVKISNCNDSRLNYVKETIEGAAIYYDNMIVILVKENEKYVLKKWKATQSNDRIFPIFPLNKVHSTKRSISENEHELSLIMINTVLLIQLIFKDEMVFERWFEQIVSQKFQPYQSTAIQYKASGASDYADIIEEESKTIVENEVEDLIDSMKFDEDNETIKNGNTNADFSSEGTLLDEQFKMNFEDEFDKIQEDLNAAVLSIAESKHYLNTKLGKHSSEPRAVYLNRLLTNVVQYTKLTSKIVAHNKEEFKSAINQRSTLSNPADNTIDQAHLNQLEEVTQNVASLVKDFREGKPNISKC